MPPGASVRETGWAPASEAIPLTAALGIYVLLWLPFFVASIPFFILAAIVLLPSRLFRRRDRY